MTKGDLIEHDVDGETKQFLVKEVDGKNATLERANRQGIHYTIEADVDSCTIVRKANE